MNILKQLLTILLIIGGTLPTAFSAQKIKHAEASKSAGHSSDVDADEQDADVNDPQYAQFSKETLKRAQHVQSIYLQKQKKAWKKARKEVGQAAIKKESSDDEQENAAEEKVLAPQWVMHNHHHEEQGDITLPRSLARALLCRNEIPHGIPLLFELVVNSTPQALRAFLESNHQLGLDNNINRLDTNNATALELCIHDHEQEKVRLLLSFKANPNILTNDSETYLHLAISTRAHHEIVQLLLTHKADPTVPNSKGNTPLHSAATRGNKAIAKILLAHDQDLCAQNKKGETSLLACLKKTNQFGPDTLAIAEAIIIKAYELGCTQALINIPNKKNEIPALHSPWVINFIEKVENAHEEDQEEPGV